ncbi:MAG: hypothetical protein IJT50_10540 [Lentisphaeria bacterium]|nr:hypothetical protein [Lentisphaeria bacterium]
MLKEIILAAFTAFVSVLKQAINQGQLRWEDLVNWFKNWLSLHPAEDENSIGFTIQETVKDVKYALVQGVFNKSTNQIEDARRIHADEVDAEVKEQCFGKEKITIFS